MAPVTDTLPALWEGQAADFQFAVIALPHICKPRAHSDARAVLQPNGSAALEAARASMRGWIGRFAL